MALARPLRPALLLLLLAACGRPGPRVELRTPHGRIVVEVDSVHAPRTAANFLRYVDGGRYDGASFYRVRREPAQLMQKPTGILQGGLWHGDSTRLLPPVPLETTRETGLRHTDGTVSMAHFPGERTVRAEFFIVLGTQPHLDWRDATATGQGFAAFGRVVEGMDVVEEIVRRPAKDELLRPRVPLRAARIP